MRQINIKQINNDLVPLFKEEPAFYCYFQNTQTYHVKPGKG
jgi:hypothetical protein